MQVTETKLSQPCHWGCCFRGALELLLSGQSRGSIWLVSAADSSTQSAVLCGQFKVKCVKFAVGGTMYAVGATMYATMCATVEGFDGWNILKFYSGGDLANGDICKGFKAWGHQHHVGLWLWKQATNFQYTDLCTIISLQPKH